MMDALQMRVLGLPAWAWGAIVGVGVVGVSYWRHAHGSATADPNSGGTDPGTATDANGNPLDTSGVASYQTDAAEDAGGYYPGPIGGVGGYNYSPPPAYTDPNAKIDPEILKKLNRLLREEQREHHTKHHKRHRTGRVPHSTVHNPNPVSPPR